MAEQRVCSVCASKMSEGWYFEAGHEYFCSHSCLRKSFGAVELQVNLDDGSLFWTDWYDELEE